MGYLDSTLPRVPNSKTQVSDYWKYLAEVMTRNGWAFETAEVIYIDPSTFAVAGDMEEKYTVGRVLWFNELFYAIVASSTYNAVTNVTTVVVDDTVIPTPLKYVHLGLDTATVPSASHDNLIGVSEVDVTSEDTVKNKHISDANAKKWEDHADAVGNVHNLEAADIGAEPAFTKETGFNLPIGTTAGTVAAGDDSRFGGETTIDDVTGLTDALAAKSDTGHTHTMDAVTDLPVFGDCVTLDVGTVTNTVAAGDHTHDEFNQSSSGAGEKLYLHAMCGGA